MVIYEKMMLRRFVPEMLVCIISVRIMMRGWGKGVCVKET